MRLLQQRHEPGRREHRDVTAADRVESRQARAGRERLVVVFEVRDATTGSLRTRYRDTSLLNFIPEETR